MSDIPMTEEFCNPFTAGENGDWVSVGDYNSLLDSHAKLEREFNLALFDAVRYRWLRHDNGDDAPFVGRYNGQSFSRWTYEHADSAIDTAMRQSPLRGKT